MGTVLGRGGGGWDRMRIVIAGVAGVGINGRFYVVPGCTKKNDGGPGDKYKAMTITPTM